MVKMKMAGCVSAHKLSGVALPLSLGLTPAPPPAWALSPPTHRWPLQSWQAQLLPQPGHMDLAAGVSVVWPGLQLGCEEGAGSEPWRQHLPHLPPFITSVLYAHEDPGSAASIPSRG